jgi:hypothetical protein
MSAIPGGNRSGLVASIGAMSASYMSLMLRVTSDRLVPMNIEQQQQQQQQHTSEQVCTSDPPPHRAGLLKQGPWTSQSITKRRYKQEINHRAAPP